MSGVKIDRRTLTATVFRSARLLCPVCGSALVFQTPFKIRHHCPACRALFQREEGFFVGAIMINVVTTEFIVLVVAALCLLVFGVSGALTLPVLLVVALLFPVAFYHHSWSLWLGADHLIETLPKHTG